MYTGIQGVASTNKDAGTPNELRLVWLEHG